MNADKIRDHKNIIVISLFIISILIDGGLFPIVNFDPDNPVDLGIVMRLMIITMARTFHKTIGSWEAVVFSEWHMAFIGVFNVTLALSGSGCRYLLEFGEVSNTYDFTAMNVAFQVLALASVSTIMCALDRRRSLEER